MKTSRYAVSKIVAILKQAETGTPAPAFCREHGMSSAFFYQWRTKDGGMDDSLITRLKELEAAYSWLKKMVADLQLGTLILRESLAKKVLAPVIGAMNAFGTLRICTLKRLSQDYQQLTNAGDLASSF
jgi:putative transposase